MIRVEVRFDEREYDLVKKEAKSRGISVSEFVRCSIRSNLHAIRKAPWMRYAGIVDSGSLESTRDIDGVIYGSSQPRRRIT